MSEDEMVRLLERGRAALMLRGSVERRLSMRGVQADRARSGLFKRGAVLCGASAALGCMGWGKFALVRCSIATYIATLQAMCSTPSIKLGLETKDNV